VRRFATTVAAPTVAAALLIAGCGGGGGGSSASSDRSACEPVRKIAALLDSKHPNTSGLTTKLEDAASAAQGAKDPEVLAAGRDLERVLGGTTTSSGGGSSSVFGLLGALNTLRKRCEAHLR
jgi:hypothetical protein